MAGINSKPVLNRIRELFKRKVDSRLIILPQDIETPIHTVTTDHCCYRYAYARSNDCRSAGDTGQDYLSLSQYREGLVFAVCDGVSQSYFGDIAAKYLGDTLINWLADYLPGGYNPDLIRTGLTAALRAAVTGGSELVDSHQLAGDIPEILREVLADKKRIGSESTFVCGRIDFPGTLYPLGRVILAWMGDTRLRVWDEYEEMTSRLEGEFETMERWSTRRGIIGNQVHTYVGNMNGLHGVKRIMAYTDGLSSLDKITVVNDDRELQLMIDHEGSLPASDDIAFFELLFEPWKSQLVGLSPR